MKLDKRKIYKYTEMKQHSFEQPLSEKSKTGPKLTEIVAWGETFEISPGIYNKLNTYKSTKDSLPSTTDRPRLKDPQLK